MNLEPALYLIPSPLSDAPLEDVLPPCHKAVVSSIRHYVVESLRTARRFLKKCDPSIDINTLTMVELNEHTDVKDIGHFLDPIALGEPVGVISDAGCPAVADPGADLVALAQQRGYKVHPLVGPSSILLGLMAAGFNGQNFAFVGYLPVEGQARHRRLKELEQRVMREHQTQVFIETPYRNNALLADLLKVLPPTMRLCVASDITGNGEHIVTRTIAQWQQAHHTCSKVPTIFIMGR